MKWVLPEVVDPPDTLCFKINVPNDRQHIAAFFGAIFLLSKPYAWGDDAGHTAIAVGRVWRRIFDQLIAGECEFPPPSFPRGIEQEDFMPLRVDCDCNVFITCCDGTEQQILTADQVRALIQQQPGQGADQPPAGGCVTYKGTLQGNGRFLLPTVVSTGDVITVLSANGLTNDGSEVPWRNYHGDEVLAGINIGAQFFNPTDVVPTAFHMALIARIGTNYYDISTPFTVPMGVANVQPVVEVNATTFPSVGGSIDLNIEVCNNQTATWSHTFDFTLNSQGWTLSPVPPGYTGTAGVYSPGNGWLASDVIDTLPSRYKFLQIVSPIVPATLITGLSVQFVGALGTVSSPPFGDALYSYNGVTVTVHQSDPASPLPTSPYAVTFSPVTMTQVAFDILVGFNVGTSDPGGSLTVARFTVTGQGSDPF
jgi:hypothetical protein